MVVLTNSIRHVGRLTKPVSKKIIQNIKKMRKLEKAYNQIVNPITLCEISWDDLGDCLPCKQFVSHFMKTTPCGEVCEFYDTVTSDKDIIESCVSFYLKCCKIERLDDKQKSLLMVKVCCFTYKVYWIVMACCGIHKTHESIVCILDYVNFIFSNIPE